MTLSVACGLATALTIGMATGCSAPAPPENHTELTEIESSGGGSVQIELGEHMSGEITADIGVAARFATGSITIRIYADSSDTPFAAPTLFPVGATGTFALSVPHGARSLTFVAVDTETGKPLPQNEAQLSVVLRERQQR
ncbi:hypothetical protein [Erythrobacter mangrovi]|uniref:Lipoprotein n=1 Tax=Erythrobacter mangrovi TaxID=2739433 RepID=A0A7D3XI71_9SPHN|nr:hypothetical protein [Erythrobacter mangrovi]QKG71873.1 hypothetical protein HQR01_11180 [Erythrobacter mangrovi]